MWSQPLELDQQALGMLLDIAIILVRACVISSRGVPSEEECELVLDHGMTKWRVHFLPRSRGLSRECGADIFALDAALTLCVRKGIVDPRLFGGVLHHAFHFVHDTSCSIS
eukprot:jgi/Botrbrau1/8072/Bobra.13_2s0038.1